jgi:hypothetical protein
MHENLERIHFAANLALMAVARQNLFALAAELFAREAVPAMATPAEAGAVQIGGAAAAEEGFLQHGFRVQK